VALPVEVVDRLDHVPARPDLVVRRDRVFQVEKDKVRSALQRDFEAVDELAASHGLLLLQDVAMPSNNRMLVWRAKD
jgi:hypothetical protein